jgi:peptidyl-prolyl cis-trans isomerase SurA
MKKHALALCIFAALCLPGFLYAEVIDRIIAIVNDDIITLKELERYVRVENEGKFVSINEYFRNARIKEKIDTFIDDMLIKQQARKLKIEVPDKEVDIVVENIKRQNLITDNDLREQLKKEKISYKDFFEGIRINMLRSRVLTRVIAPDVSVTDQMLRDYYNSHAEEMRGEEYKLQQIFVSGQRPDAKERIGGAYTQLKEGKPFEVVVMEFSDDGSGPQGGDIGYVKAEDLMPMLRDAVTKLTPGAFTPIIQSPYGFLILKLNQVKKADYLPFEATKDKIHEKIVQIEGEKRYREYLEKLRKSSYIEVKI